MTKRIVLEGRHVHKAITIGDDEEFPPEYVVADYSTEFGHIDPGTYEKVYFYPITKRKYENGDIDVFYRERRP